MPEPGWTVQHMAQGAATGNEDGTVDALRGQIAPTTDARVWTVGRMLPLARRVGAAQSLLDALDRVDAERGITRVNAADPSPAVVERVARAIHGVEFGTYSETAHEHHNRWTWDGELSEHEPFLAYARAALAALAPEVKP